MSLTLLEGLKGKKGYSVSKGTFSTALQEQSITNLHNVSFMNTRHFLTTVRPCKFKRKPSDSLRTFTCHYLQHFHYSWDVLVFKVRVFTWEKIEEN